jgi:Ran GTPase-activating protein (RanGAP) involved in mRNA processing and transport
MSKALASGRAKLKSLVLPKNLISCIGARILATGLHIHGRVQRLDLSDNRCGDQGAEYLAFLVSQSKALRVLRLRGNDIQPRGATALAKALIQNRITSQRTLPRSLQELDLACNQIGDGGAAAFSAVLRLNGTLRSLDISSTPSPSSAHGSCHARWKKTGRWIVCR